MTAFYQFLPGVAMTYMGQELALNHKPDLFEKDPIDRAKGDSEFLRYFLASHSAAKEAKRQAPFSHGQHKMVCIIFCAASKCLLSLVLSTQRFARKVIICLSSSQP